MNLIKRKQVEGRHKIFNQKTNRWINQDTQTGKKYMKEQDLTQIGTTTTKRKGHFKEDVSTTREYTVSRVKTKAFKTPIYQKNLRSWIVKNFIDKPTTLSVFTNAILDQLSPNMENINIKIRGKRKDDAGSFRTIPIDKDITFTELLNKLIHLTEDQTGGSDQFSEDVDIDTAFFSIAYKQTPAGGSRKTTYTAINTEYFKTHSYPAKEGDCLLVIINEGHHTAKIRRDLNLEGPIKIDDIPILEKYLNININIYYDTVEIKKELFDSDEANITKTSTEYVYYYESPNIYSGDLYEILLKDNHYSEIIKFEKLEFDQICGDRLKVVKGETKKLSDLAIRKSLIRQGRKIAGTETKTYTPKLLFYDIETIFNPAKACLLEAYTVAWHIAEAESHSKVIKKFDKDNINTHMKNTHFLKGPNCMKEFVRWIEQNDKDIQYTLIGYNNSRFDNFVLLKELIDNDSFNNMMFVQNSILTMNFSNRHSCFDLCRFVMTSLKSACDDFKVYPQKQKGFSHTIPQDAFMKDGWTGLNKWLTDNQEKIISYNKIDVLATEALFNIVDSAYRQITDSSILEFTTLASLSFENFKDICRLNKKDISAPLNSTDDKFIRSAIIGGRCQDFKVSEDDFKSTDYVACVDVKSLYPYVMLNRFYPVGEYKYTSKYRSDKLGIYTVKISKQPDIKIIPNRSTEPNAVLDWDYDGKITKTLTSTEIECLKRHGAEFKFLTDEDGNIGIYWKESVSDLFTDFFKPIEEEKTRQDKLKDTKDKEYNPAMRNITKLLLNSLSGKMVQRNFEDTTELMKSEKEEAKFNNKTSKRELILSIGEYRLLKGDLKEDRIYKAHKAKPSHLGVFIYAHARTYMYDLLYSKYKCLYTDTDSAFLMWEDWKDFESKFIKTVAVDENDVHKYYKLTSKNTGVPTLGKKFGQFEEELNINPKEHTVETHILAKKIYCVEIKDKTGEIIKGKKSKYRLKGINLIKDSIITDDIVEEINKFKEDEVEERVLYLYKLKKELDKNISFDKNDDAEISGNIIQVYRDLKKGPVNFLVSSIKKKNLDMRQTYSIKTVNINQDDEVEIELNDV